MLYISRDINCLSKRNAFANRQVQLNNIFCWDFKTKVVKFLKNYLSFEFMRKLYKVSKKISHVTLSLKMRDERRSGKENLKKRWIIHYFYDVTWLIF